MVGEALRNLHNAYLSKGILATEVKTLDGVRLPLEAYAGILNSLKGSDGVTQSWPLRRQLVSRAYVEIAGIGGRIDASATVSLGKELAQASKEVGGNIGSATAGLANFVGDTAGGLVGGLLKGLGPIVLAVLALVIYVKFFYKGK